MKKITLFFSTLLFLSYAHLGCERKYKTNQSFENSTFEAEIIGFETIKCYCCWGWEIKIGNQIIKADSLPNPSEIGYTIKDPIPVIIETGEIKIKCGDNPDYYEIKTLTIK